MNIKVKKAAEDATVLEFDDLPEDPAGARELSRSLLRALTVPGARVAIDLLESEPSATSKETAS